MAQSAGRMVLTIFISEDSYCFALSLTRYKNKNFHAHPRAEIHLFLIKFRQNPPWGSWMPKKFSSVPSAASAAALVPTARGAAARLFGFGHDAWLLTAYLERLGSQPGAHVSGATGLLALGEDGNIERAPAWSTFRGGSVVPLADARRR